MKVFLAGEGKTELGRHALTREYAAASKDVGLEALVRRHDGDLEIVGAELWKSKVPKLGVGKGIGGAETKTVRGLALMAAEKGAEALVFARDRDGDRARQRDVEAGLDAARRENPTLRIVGGVAIEMIECWLLALRGQRRSQTCHDPKGELANQYGVTNLEQKVELVQEAKLEPGAIPADAESLLTWLKQARDAFGAPR